MNKELNRYLVFVLGVLVGLVVAFGLALCKMTWRAPESAMVCPTLPASSDHRLAPDNPVVTADSVAAAPALAPLAASAPELPAPNPAPEPVAAEQAPSASQPQPEPQPEPVSLLIPVADIKASQLSDTFKDARGENRVHDAIDIMAPKGTAVVAAADGKVVKLFTSVPGGLTIYQFDLMEQFAYYYAHLDGYVPGLVEGTMVKRGDLLGYVGSTGNANIAAPHLHFAIFQLGPEKRWWQGTAINPYPLLTTP